MAAGTGAASALVLQRENGALRLAFVGAWTTRELARLLGEAEFQCVFHEGAKSSVYMQSTATDLLFALESASLPLEVRTTWPVNWGRYPTRRGRRLRTAAADPRVSTARAAVS